MELLSFDSCHIKQVGLDLAAVVTLTQPEKCTFMMRVIIRSLRILMCPDSHLGSVICKKKFAIIPALDMQYTKTEARKYHRATKSDSGDGIDETLWRQSADLAWLIGIGREPASTFKARREFT
jgi:hypothetical protein